MEPSNKEAYWLDTLQAWSSGLKNRIFRNGANMPSLLPSLRKEGCKKFSSLAVAFFIVGKMD